MDCKKAGALLKQLRTERGMTQREIAEQLFVSDLAVPIYPSSTALPLCSEYPLKLFSAAN